MTSYNVGICEKQNCRFKWILIKELCVEFTPFLQRFFSGKYRGDKRGFPEVRMELAMRVVECVWHAHIVIVKNGSGKLVRAVEIVWETR